MYMYSYPAGQADGWWWHNCPRLGTWVRACRNRDLALARTWNDERLLCPYCHLRGTVQRHRTYGAGDLYSAAVYLDDATKGWRYARPNGEEVQINW